MKSRMMNWLLRVAAVILVGLGIAGYLSVLRQRVPPFRTEWAIAFESNRSSYDNDIFLYENGKIRQLVENDEYDGRVSWSPDGTRLLYEGYRDPEDISASSFDARSNLDIWLYDLQLQDVTALTTHPADDYQPTWSPDGTRIAFISRRAGADTGGVDLFVLVVETGKITRITKDSAHIAQIAWSPDGRSIAFASRFIPHEPNSFFNIYLADVTSQPVPQIRAIYQHPDSSELLPRFSPDGRYLSFLTNINSNQNIVLINIETNQQFNLLPPGYSIQENIAWSPDGNIAVLSAFDGNAPSFNDIHFIDMTDISGSGSRIVETIAIPGNDVRPTWSPDGKQIAFVNDRRVTGRFAYAGHCEIVIYDRTTRIQHHLTKAPEGICDNNPVWQPAP